MRSFWLSVFWFVIDGAKATYFQGRYGAGSLEGEVVVESMARICFDVFECFGMKIK
jgi:hypothetical protein